MYFRPKVEIGPVVGPLSVSLAGGWTRVSEVEVLSRTAPPEVIPFAEAPQEVQERLMASRAPISDLTMDTPRLMGILNVTPDSFSDGGTHDGVAAALARAYAMVGEGADLIDIGGESTRPGATDVPVVEEIARIRPVIEALTTEGPSVPLSLDTRKAAVARAGLTAGAQILNDVSGLRFDPELATVAADFSAPLMLMHSIGTPKTMQGMAETAYTDVLLDVYDALETAVAQAEAAGVPRQSIVVDPGIGFGKTDDQNRALLSRISLFHSLGCPILLGASRKGFVGRVAQVSNASDRGPGSAGLALWAVSQGVQFLRIHDIEMHRQAIALWRAVSGVT